MKFLMVLLKAAGVLILIYVVFYVGIILAMAGGASDDAMYTAGYATGRALVALVQTLWLPVLALGAIWFLLRRFRPAARP